MYPHFTLAYWCVLVAALLPLVCAGIAKFGRFGKPAREGGFDNHNPRAWLARQTDWRARANAAQANSFEALPFFIGAVIIAHQLQAPQARVDILAFLYIVLRMAFILIYVAGFSTLRTVVWSMAFVVNLSVLLVAYR